MSGEPAQPLQEGAATATHRAPSGVAALSLAAIGVVYGDIGTSPLYALRETLAHVKADGVRPDEAIGVVSLLLWALTATVTLKYVAFLVFADNRGEGGMLSLTALAQQAIGRRVAPLFFIGLAGASLFAGDAIITPAISVLSAVEGLTLLTPRFEHFVIPAALAILVALFFVQRFGTGGVAAFFGPAMLLWFATLAGLGLWHIPDDWRILAALDPTRGLVFLRDHGIIGVAVLGSVFLAVTGAEALYADMGHFGRKPIQLAWLVVVFPALALNYLGQGAMLLARPETAENPFYLMAPAWALAPLVVLATVATVIASQATITGAYSLARQAIQLGLLPRMAIQHTSETQEGQIYLPRINRLMAVGVVLLVVIFRNSSALASAYGVAVSGTMAATTTLAFVVVWKGWRWPLPAAAALCGFFLVIDLAFFGANLVKIGDGGYIPLILGGLTMLVALTWMRGSALLAAKTKRDSLPLDDLVRMLERSPPQRVPGAAVFLTSDLTSAPSCLMHNLKHNRVLHERVILLSVETAATPRVADADRLRVEEGAFGFTTIAARFGFMESPHVPTLLALLRKRGVRLDIMRTSFFLGRRSLRPAAESAMPRWQDAMFIALARQATPATEFFSLPSNRVVELGAQVTI